MSSTAVIWDKGVPGLRLRIGKRAVTWQYFSQRRDHGDRAHTFKTLGRYDRGSRLTAVGGGAALSLDSHDPGSSNYKDGPRVPPAVYAGAQPTVQRAPWHMSVDAAREAATVERAGVIKGTPSVNPEAGPTFSQAFDGGYQITEGRKSVKIDGYLQHLERQAKEAGKPARWAEKVRSLGRVYMTPQWENTVSLKCRSPPTSLLIG